MIKAVITAAGKGVRLLPMTKEMPKEMLPVFSRIYDNKRTVLPLLQLIFEQLYACNIRDYCFVVGRGKRTIEDHFTPDSEFLSQLSAENRNLLSHFYRKLENSHIIWVNQSKPKGFGDAVRITERFVGRDSFVVHAGDVSIIGKSKHPILRLLEHRKDPTISAVLLFRKVKDPQRHGIAKLKKISDDVYEVEDIEEKPVNPKSNNGLMPLYFFTPKIFDNLKKIELGVGGEYQLTDAIRDLIHRGGKVIAIPILNKESVLDVGTAESYRQSQDSSYKYA